MEAGAGPAAESEAAIDTFGCGALGIEEVIPVAVGFVEINGLGTSHAGPWCDDNSRLPVAGWEIVNLATVPCLDELVGGTAPEPLTVAVDGGATCGAV